MTPPQTLVIGCGALARELLDIVALNKLTNVHVECLPATLHMTPAKITPAVIERVERAGDRYDRILIGYADCGTMGTLDDYISAAPATPQIERLPGEHCYEFFATPQRFASLQDAEPGTFYLTDYLVKHFDRIVWGGLGLVDHPELRDAYFGNYARVIYLSQVDDPRLLPLAEAAAAKLGLPLEVEASGYGDLQPAVVEVARRKAGAI